MKKPKRNKVLYYPDNQIDNAIAMNVSTKIMYFNLFKQIAMTEFVYTGLPDTVDERYLENALFNYGGAVFFKDDILNKFLCLNVAYSSDFDVYGYPKRVNAFSNYNGYNCSVSEDNFVIIFNDYTRTTPYFVADMYAERIAEVQRTIDINAKAQKTPILIKCDDDERLTLKNVYEQYDGNTPVIAVSNSLNLAGGFQVLQTQAPFVADKLTELKRHLYTECLEMLGVARHEEKRERFITAELDMQQMNSNAFGASRLLARKQAVDKINKMFGLNITVERREKPIDVSKEIDNMPEE